MANFGLIDFKLGLNIKVNVNARQNKFKVHNLKPLAKMAINWHKIGQMPLLCKNIQFLRSFFNMHVFEDRSNGDNN